MNSTTMSGFPEYSPSQQYIEQQWLKIIEEVFRLKGYPSINTRCVETLDALDSKSDTSKEIYAVSRRDRSGLQEDAFLGLRYDLTVPLARYVTERQSMLNFPFARYQVGKVWRGDRPQEGRYREFTQVDLDAFSNTELTATDDAKVIITYAQMFERLASVGLPAITVRINNRKLVQGFYESIGLDEDQIISTLRAVDKLEKTDAYSVYMDLIDGAASLTPSQAKMCLMLAEINGMKSAAELRSALSVFDISSVTYQMGVDELCAVLDAVSSMTSVVCADLSIARGLDYYSGTVVESSMEGYASLGSVCSGGRYDNLARSSSGFLPGFGLSFGLSRVLGVLFAAGLTTTRSVPTCVLVSRFEDDDYFDKEKVAQRLRDRGIATEVCPTNWKVGKQIKYAQKRGIPFVWFVSTDGDSVKDIRIGEQVPADIATWNPMDITDLEPQIIFSE